MPNSNQKIDLDGSLGAIADASWSERWICFTAKELDQYIADVAQWGPLSLSQMEYLLQGLPPPPKTWLTPPTCMVEFESLIVRLRQDISRGALPGAPTADEFAAWCDCMGADLPPTLVSALRAVKPHAPSAVVTPQATTPMVYASWIPWPLSKSSPAKAQVRKRGRPQKAPDRNPSMLEAGTEVLMGAARKGQTMTLPNVAKAVQKMPCAQGMTVANITRRMKGELPVEQAKATATKNGAIVVPRGVAWRDPH